MKNFLLNCSLFFAFISSANAFIPTSKAEMIDCFIAREGKNYLIKEGNDCLTRYSPASTFKIPLAVIGYETKFLKDENHPIWKSEKPVTKLQDYWSGAKTPLSWMKYSVVWYSQILTTKLGMERFQNYINKLNYGNRNLAGNNGLNDGLTESWLSSSLLISPFEQVAFIEKLAKNQLPFSKEAQMKTKNLIRLFEESILSDEWVIYGKTGTDVDRKTGERRGYFVGFATKGKRLVSFVIHITGKVDSRTGGLSSKKFALERIMKVLEKN